MFSASRYVSAKFLHIQHGQCVTSILTVLLVTRQTYSHIHTPSDTLPFKKQTAASGFSSSQPSCSQTDLVADWTRCNKTPGGLPLINNYGFPLLMCASPGHLTSTVTPRRLPPADITHLRKTKPNVVSLPCSFESSRVNKAICFVAKSPIFQRPVNTNCPHVLHSPA